jgi:Putative Actinobacterial Holin-X, holin superfamily III
MDKTHSSPELAAEIVGEAERLVRLEIALAKAELKELAITNAIAAGAFLGAAVLVSVTLLAAVPVLIVVAVEPHWLAALAWIAIYLVAAAGLALLGRSKLRIGIPQRTVDSIKETRDWALRQMRSPGR